MIKRTSILLVILLGTSQLYGQIKDHSAFNSLLQKYVSSTGKVNYKGFKESITQLDNYLSSLAKKAPTASTPRNEAKAYWFNLYNASTIKLICDHYPIKSIKDIAGGKPWDKKWIKIGHKTYSLNQIENEIIRPTFKDGRIHFAINCAAKSCPPLANKAFTKDNVASLLKKRTQKFINDSTFNKLNKSSIQISPIFDWYSKDFGNLIEFINKYAKIKAAPDAKISYKKYNWSLNN